MTPEEIIADYDSAVQVLDDYTAQEAAKIGNSQRGLGLMAERVASPSGQTSGLANYTYDRTMRPTVNTLAASLATTGKAQALENLLNTKLREAKNNYEDAKNAYTVASTTPSTSSTSSSGGVNFSEQTDRIYNYEKDVTAEAEKKAASYVPTQGDKDMTARYVLNKKRNPNDGDTFTWQGVEYVYHGNGQWTTKVY